MQFPHLSILKKKEKRNKVIIIKILDSASRSADGVGFSLVGSYSASSFFFFDPFPVEALLLERVFEVREGESEEETFGLGEAVRGFCEGEVSGEVFCGGEASREGGFCEGEGRGEV